MLVILYIFIAFVNLRVHRNSLGIHLSNLLRKDSQEEEEDEWNEQKFSKDNKDKSSYSHNLSESSTIGLKHLVLKHLGKLNNNKKSGRKLVVTFDLHSVTKSNRRSSKVSTTTSDEDENSERYSADEENDVNSEEGM